MEQSDSSFKDKKSTSIFVAPNAFKLNPAPLDPISSGFNIFFPSLSSTISKNPEIL